VNVDLVHATPVGEEKEEALLHAAIGVELGPPTAEVALAFTIIEDLQLIRRLAAATLPQHHLGELIAFHDLRELGGQAKKPQ
jgi:hypothetical protein